MQADGPVSKFDFVNDTSHALSSVDPQPANHAFALRSVVGLGGPVLVGSRQLVSQIFHHGAGQSARTARRSDTGFP